MLVAPVKYIDHATKEEFYASTIINAYKDTDRVSEFFDGVLQNYVLPTIRIDNIPAVETPETDPVFEEIVIYSH